jgi:hypothetical protein
MTNQKNKNYEIAEKALSDPYWRLNNLYYIVDKRGKKILFKCNWAQEKLYHDVWYCNIILKARQLGMSTFVCLLFLDRCLFNDHMSAGIIAHTVEDAQHMFRRVKFAYDNLPDEIKKIITADNNTAQMFKFSNGSSIRVGTSLRSSTFQYLHISEFGKICAKYPDKAREIVTGSLNTLAVGQYVFIESTAEGREGYFYDICRKAKDDRDSDKKLSKLDFKFHFFPWWGQPDYRIGSPVTMGQDLHNYFINLRSLGINLDEEQQSWYALRQSTQQDDMKREFPSTPEECWEVSNAGTYYAKHLTTARIEKRICFVPYDEQLPVHTSWDLGYNDSTSIIFFQVYGKEIRIIDYVEGSGESLAHWLGVVKSKPYIYDKHLAPHDIKAHEYTSGMTRQASARKMGVSLLAVPKVEVIQAIDEARGLFNRMWFDERKCEKLLQSLDNYKKSWNERVGCWDSKPLHDWSSHGADAFRTLATGLFYITGAKTQAEKMREELEERKDESGLYPGSYLYTPKSDKPRFY